ncbi:MAG TPA: hypothetical protein PLS49_02040, partial [Candidatus Woesebacteria bacterium]|nr:hypothetical protein [Candidatus Woesebacteria bacterium]
GVTFLRTDFFIQFSLPTTTIEAYKNNTNNIQDPKNWNTTFIQQRKEIFKNAKERDMQTLGIVSYAPSWLTYSGTTQGVPKDWNIYEDLVKKTYKLHRDSIDYVEIWNEPTHTFFLDIKNSPYTREEAYSLIFKHGAHAITQVDEEINDGKKVQIGAQISHNPSDMTILKAFLTDTEIYNYIDFISYHNYVSSEPSNNEIIRIIQKSPLKDKPLILSEWNYDSKENVDNPYKTGNEAITFTANKLIDFNKMSLLGANYYSLFPIDESSQTLGHGYLAFYKEISNKPQLLPQAKTWRLLSKSLELGNGKNYIVKATERDDINSLGFINSNGVLGGTFVNNTDSSGLIEFFFKNTSIKKRAKINIYIASPHEDGGKVVDSRTVYPENGVLNFRYLIAQNAVLGIKIYEEDHWYDILDPILRIN